MGFYPTFMKRKKNLCLYSMLSYVMNTYIHLCTNMYSDTVCMFALFLQLFTVQRSVWFGTGTRISAVRLVVLLKFLRFYQFFSLLLFDRPLKHTEPLLS
jgi:purine-cytosine permease-like protein